MIRVAAVADVHIGLDSGGELGSALARVNHHADVLLFGGDLTKLGTVAEARLFVDELTGVTIPIAAVLGNHDHQSDEPDGVVEVLCARGIAVLEGTTTVIEHDDVRLGIAGAKGFGGGFAATAGSAFGEREMKRFIQHTEQIAGRLHDGLRQLDESGCTHRIALLHYAPVAATVAGEPLEIYPFLGSQLLGEAIDDAGADLVLHGHAHSGTEHGTTPRGIPVRNVALPVICESYRIFELGA